MTALHPAPVASRRWMWVALVALLVGALVATRVALERPTARTAVAIPHRVALVDPPELAPPTPRPELEQLEETPSDAPYDETAAVDASAGPPALDEMLGVEGEGQAGFDAFGLRAKRGGRDIMLDVERGSRQAIDTRQIVSFAERLANELEADFRQVPELRRSDYTARLRVWVDGDGRIGRCELAGSSGEAQIDARLREVVDSTDVCVGPPPAGFPNPVVLVVRSRAQR